MKKITILLLSLLFVFTLVACGGNSDTDTDTDTETVDENTDTEITDTETDTDTEKESDPVETGPEEEPDTETEDEKESTYITPTVENTLKEELKVFDKADTYGDEGNVLDYTTAYSVDVSKEASSKRFKIDQSGTYRIYGTSADGGIYINAPEQTVVLVFDGVSLTSKYDYPTIYAEDCKSLTIVLNEGKKNYLYDTANNDGEGAVIRVRSCNLKITGKGTLNIDANSKYGISNTKELTIESGNINITSPSYAIFGKKGVNIDGGKLSLTSANKGGIKSGDENDKDGAVVGYVKINSSSTTIDCATNGINSYGTVEIKDGRINIKAKSGNAIDTSENVTISGGTMIFESYKSTIATDGNVTIDGKANLKLTTKGNGISAKDISISTSGVIYIKTSAVYEVETADTPDEDTRYVYVDGKYEKYDTTIHSLTAKLYTRRSCKGLNAKKIVVSNGTIGINSYEDAFNATSAKDTNVNGITISGGCIVVSTKGDAIQAESIAVSGKSDISVLKSERGLTSNYINISGGEISVIADKDAISMLELTATVYDKAKINKVEISGGFIYLFEKIDTDITSTQKATVTVNGGIIFIVCGKNNPQATSGNASYVSGAVENKELATKGAWLRVSSGNSDYVLVQLPKDYTEKMIVYYSSATVGEELTVDIGRLSEDGSFIAKETETLK